VTEKSEALGTSMSLKLLEEKKRAASAMQHALQQHLGE